MGSLDNNNCEFPTHTKNGDYLIPYYWCDKNSIEIRPQYSYKDGLSQWQIAITINNKTSIDPKIYEKKDIMDKIYEYSEYYYKKYSNSKIEEQKRKCKPIWSDDYKTEKEQKV